MISRRVCLNSNINSKSLVQRVISFLFDINKVSWQKRDEENAQVSQVMPLIISYLILHVFLNWFLNAPRCVFTFSTALPFHYGLQRVTLRGVHRVAFPERNSLLTSVLIVSGLTSFYLRTYSRVEKVRSKKENSRKNYCALLMKQCRSYIY